MELKAGKQLKELRNGRGITQQALADKVNRDVSSIARHETGSLVIAQDTAEIICDALELTENERQEFMVNIFWDEYNARMTRYSQSLKKIIRSLEMKYRDYPAIQKKIGDLAQNI